MLNNGFAAQNASKPIYDPIHDHTGYRVGARIARVQILIAFLLGSLAFMVFCVLRKRYPRIYVANFNQANQHYFHSFTRQSLPRLPTSLFGWIPVVYRINETQILEHAGLDAVVFLGFFKMCIRALAIMVLFAYLVISPIRYKFTGRVDYPDPGDGDDSDDELARIVARGVWSWIGYIYKKKNNLDQYEAFLWMYTVFTYVFTFVLLYSLQRQTSKIINMRQQYLGKQNSVTDRTVKLLGIPPVLREADALKRHINSLGVGEVERVAVVKEWNTLNKLFKMRKRVLHKLEEQWMEYFKQNHISSATDINTSRILSSVGDSFSMRGASVPIPYSDQTPSEENAGRTSPTETVDTLTNASIIDQISEHLEDRINGNDASLQLPFLADDAQKRPRLKKGLLGLFGPDVDAINYYNEQLEVIDKEIKRYRLREFPPSSTAFITMKSVAQAQMLAQAVLDPKINHLITSLAPAPHDIIWDNLCLTRKERNTRIFLVMVFIGLVSGLLVFPVRFLTNFLNVNSISKVAPKFAEFLEAHKWAETLITGLLPPYVFTIFNIVMPYFYIWMTKRQGYTSHADEELSAVSKNFFYIFVNLFLVFTLFGTATLSDTAQLAYQLAESLKKLSLFYVDLIILQGIGIFPYKLLLLGNLLKYPIGNLFWCKTPRDYLNLYKPPVFNFGLQLPQPILILIVVVTYSVISTKILTAGLIYFIIGYSVFKYQLLYACVHPPHNTGKVWPFVVRRVMMGLIIFHMMMFGTLALEKAFACAMCIVPLPLFTMFLMYHFNKHYIPLSTFIALRSIEDNELPYHGDEEEELVTGGTSSGADRAQTLDERREVNETYEFPNLISDLDGPLVAVDHGEVLYVGPDGSTIRKLYPMFQ